MLPYVNTMKRHMPNKLTLFDDISNIGVHTLSIVGTAKNTGKTVTLNHLIQAMTLRGHKVGITSIGRDGEVTDIVTLTQKPRIFAPPHTLVATAKEVLRHSHLNWEYIADTGHQTPLGSVFIARCHEPGYVELIGPPTIAGLKDVCAHFDQHGVGFSLIDGAFNRASLAAPAVSEATIVATGAALDQDIKRIVDKTAHHVGLLQLDEETEACLCAQAQMFMQTGASTAIQYEDGTWQRINHHTLLGQPEIWGHFEKAPIGTVFISGGLVNSVIDTLRKIAISQGQALKVVVRDATCVFVDKPHFQRFSALGCQIRVLRPIRVVGVTVNPWSPQGWMLDAHQLCSTLSARLPQVPIHELHRGIRCLGGVC